MKIKLSLFIAILLVLSLVLSCSSTKTSEPEVVEVVEETIQEEPIKAELIDNYLYINNHRVDIYLDGGTLVGDEGEILEKANADGYVETMFGRRRNLPELTSSKHMIRAFGERVARNMPIQGTAADIIKIAMIKVDERMKAENLRARLVLQVHDELIVEAPQDESMRVALIVQEEMENAVKMSVPLTADAAIGRTWYDAKG